MMRIEDIAALTQSSEGVERLSSGASAPAERLSLADAELLDGVREGRHAAFEQLVMRFQPMVYGLLYRVLNDPEDARDVTQETFLKVYQYAKSFRGDSELKTWIYRIAVNQASNHQRWWRRRWRRETISLHAVALADGAPLAERLASQTEDPERQAIFLERQRMLTAALADLKFDFRVAVVMRDIKGLSYDEIADALQISVGTVKSRIARGREELRRKLKGQF
jgi:RNA polymerase sigma-70 factor (ECF subfamily)